MHRVARCGSRTCLGTRRPALNGMRSSDGQWKPWLVELVRSVITDLLHGLIASGELQLAADNTHDLPSVPGGSD